MIRQFELVEKVKSYDPRADEDALNRAYVFSMKAHGSQTRASGDPYFSHPLEVAGILTDYRLDWASIVTALLHDTVEDTVATLEEIEGLFGPEIGRLVDGVTKLSRLELQTPDSKQAENFRKLLLATSEDIRVLLVKLADRLHNMRTLSYIDKEAKRRRIALETMEIYAPLAERMGMQEIKDELENLSFEHINPDAFNSIIARLEYLKSEDDEVVPHIVQSLDDLVGDAGIKARVYGREKRPSSIWRKMQRKHVGFDQLSDIMAFRVIVGTEAECYQALGLVHTHYPMVPDQFDDYISTPKPNGYRSLHTAVIGPEGRRIEVQIRTREMHDLAEFGVAAHWRYKQSDGPLTDGRSYRWLRELLDILENAAGPEEFLAHTKMEMFQDQVFCFTPNGDLIALPSGATPIDFAYAVHSEVGDACVGAKINGTTAPLRRALQNGDQVEIVTSDEAAPSPGWEQLAATGKARAHIRRFVRGEERREFARLGRSILERAYAEAGFRPSQRVVRRVLEALDLENEDELNVAIGRGELPLGDVLDVMAPAAKEKVSLNVVPFPSGGRDGEAPPPVPIRGLREGMAVHMSSCCHPLPGDRIVGIMTLGKGVAIHTIDCVALESFHETPERWIDVAWDLQKSVEDTHVGRIEVIVSNERGALGNLTTVIANNLANINNLKITHRAKDFFEMVVDVEVSDTRHLNEIIAALRAEPAISSAERAQG